MERTTDKIIFMHEGDVILYDDIQNIMKRYGKVLYKITLKNGESRTVSSLKEFLPENVVDIKIIKNELEDIFEVILSERAN